MEVENLAIFCLQQLLFLHLNSVRYFQHYHLALVVLFDEVQNVTFFLLQQLLLQMVLVYPFAIIIPLLSF